MNAFEDARTATEEMFENDNQLSLEDAIQAPETEEPTAEEAEAVAEEQATEENAVALDDAVNTAEIAAQAAQEKDMQLQQALQELEALKAQNQQMQGTLDELSKKNEENLIEEAMEMPTLDVNGLAFATEEEVAQAQADYAKQMAEFVKAGVMKEVSPFVEQAKDT